MITVDDARDIAKHHLHTLGEGLTLFVDPIISGDYGWVFTYQSTAFVETNEIGHALGGNAPLLVDRSHGRVFTLGTAYELSRYVEMYECFGDPHAVPGPTLELCGAKVGADRVLATKEIKAHTQLGLKEAKGVVDACVEGAEPILVCADPETAEKLARELAAAGFDVTQLAL